MDISSVRKNTKLLVDNTPYNVEEAEFTKPGKGRAIYRLKLRNLLDGGIIEHTHHSGAKVEEAYTTNQEEQYLYKEGEHYIFMNTGTFEQRFVAEAQLGNKKDFLKEGMVVDMLMMGDKPIDITLPSFVELKVVEGEVTIKKGTVAPQMKSAILETGYTIAVPAFIREGDTIKVDTRTGTYVERIVVKK